MKIYDGISYYEVGDSVIQDHYPGCPAKVYEIVDERFKSGRTTLYRIKIDATGHPEATDENGEPETVKWALITREGLDHLNRPEKK